MPTTRRASRAAAQVAPLKAPAIRRERKPLRTAGILVAVVGLLATVALPAYGALEGATSAAGAETTERTVQQEAQDSAQKFVAGSDAKDTEVARGSYSATTRDEIDKKKAEAAALERAKAAAAAAAASSSSSSGYNSSNVDLNMTAPGSGEVRWPLASIQEIGEGFMARGGEHQGVDFVDPQGTPIYAAHSGVVTVSSDGYYGYGVAVKIKGEVNGVTVETTYGHMPYGARLVEVGQTVTVGQPIGAVGSTGWSTGPHLHFEVDINGVKSDPLAWLRANAG
ncbi:M23 family metallopeptidase [Microbacterium gorillae]|uniref:M23 family metallopeptidase n=1 Tax=Microbacterium gorillae TaxID=1231063 RepID=UPI002DDD2945|nr:M23 family metallopeptidase [Microbacterium gorillae]